MGRSTLLALAGLLAMSTAHSTADAADLMPLPPPPAAYQPAPIDVGGGFYLRGDVGVGILDFDKAEIKSLDGADLSALRTIDTEIDDQVFVGVGLGYQFNSWLRADLTAEYRTKTKFSTYDNFSGGYTDANHEPYVFDGANFFEGGYSSVVGLANVYFDLGTWHGITPFIGAGVGFAYNQVHSSKDQGLARSFHAHTYPEYIPGHSATGGHGRGHEDVDLAWAVHAGLAYDVTPNFKVEAAYRYLNLGDAKTGAVQCYASGCLTETKLKDLDSHDFKLGMRWVLAKPETVYPAGPLIRKY